MKSTMFEDRGGYSCTVRGSEGPYQGDPFDYLAAYVFQEDMWYIIPAEMVVGQGSIALYPRLKRSKYGVYKEAWDRLRGPARVDRIEAYADETFAEDFAGGGWALLPNWDEGARVTRGGTWPPLLCCAVGVEHRCRSNLSNEFSTGSSSGDRRPSAELRPRPKTSLARAAKTSRPARTRAPPAAR
jgi:hypothetical protein